MDISKAELDEHCYLNTVKDGKTTFSILDQKRVETVRILQEKYGFPSDKDFINALECNSIEGANFGRRDVKIVNEISGYSKGAAMGRFKHPQKGGEEGQNHLICCYPIAVKDSTTLQGYIYIYIS